MSFDRPFSENEAAKLEAEQTQAAKRRDAERQCPGAPKRPSRPSSLPSVQFNLNLDSKTAITARITRLHSAMFNEPQESPMKEVSQAAVPTKKV